MVELVLYNGLDIQVNTDDFEYLKRLNEYFTHYVEGFMFNPKYTCGMWDGKTSLFNTIYRTFPYGLLVDFLKFHNKWFKNVPLHVDNAIKDLHKSDPIEIITENRNNWEVRDYQYKSVEKALQKKKCIIRAATGAGKSFIIFIIILSLLRAKKIYKPIIIVPTTNLIEQFRSDLIDYGFDDSDIGIVFADTKQWDRTITISTRQSLVNYQENLEMYDCVIVDETHTSGCRTLKDILYKVKNADYRIGCTGTMPETTLDQLQVRSYLGPIVFEISAKELQDKGVLADCMINIINISYEESIRGSYDEIKDSCFKKRKRMNIIRKIVSDIKKGPVLLLVGKVENEGVILEEYFRSCPELEYREIVFISGKDKLKKREEYRQKCVNGENIILIATYPLFQAGINIPCLGHVVFASSFKSKIRILQSIGRALRTHLSKDIAQIYDIVDCIPVLEKHSSARKKFYKDEEFNINEINIK